MTADDRVRRIERSLRDALSPRHLELIDDSERHRGHRGATSGGGHYRLLIVAGVFAGLGRVDRHRLVHDALDGLFGETIHALSIRALTPEEWNPDR